MSEFEQHIVQIAKILQRDGATFDFDTIARARAMRPQLGEWCDHVLEPQRAQAERKLLLLYGEDPDTIGAAKRRDKKRQPKLKPQPLHRHQVFLTTWCNCIPNLLACVLHVE